MPALIKHLQLYQYLQILNNIKERLEMADQDLPKVTIVK